MPLPNYVQLPLPPASDDEFDDMVRDVLRIMYANPALTRLGRRGQNQSGIDGFDPLTHDAIVWQATVQRKDLPAKLQRDLESMDKAWSGCPKAFIFATALPRDGELQRFALKLTEARVPVGKSPVTVIFWDDIGGQILDTPQLRARYYPWLGTSETQPACHGPWAILQTSEGLSVSSARYVARFPESSQTEPWLLMAFRVINVGSQSAERLTVRMEFRDGVSLSDATPASASPTPQSVVAATLNGDQDATTVEWLLPFLPAGSSAELQPVRLPARTSRTIYSYQLIDYEISATPDLQRTGFFALDVAVRPEQSPIQRWEPSRTWHQNIHPDREDLVLAGRSGRLLVHFEEPFAIDAEIYDNPENRHLAAWRERGWIKETSPPPWSQPGQTTYVYRNPKVPRLLVFRAAASPRVIGWNDRLELTPEDIGLHQNALLREYVSKRLVVAANDFVEPPPHLTPPVDLGFCPGVLVDPITCKPITGEALRKKLVRSGKRPWVLAGSTMDRYIDAFIAILKRVTDPNGIAAGTMAEAEAWMELELSPSEVKQVIHDAERRGLLAPVVPIESNFFAVRLT